jgi:hypothetical protein
MASMIEWTQTIVITATEEVEEAYTVIPLLATVDEDERTAMTEAVVMVAEVEVVATDKGL